MLEVTDDGPGLPPGAVDDAFRRGWSTKEQGSAGRRGIGLALVAQTVDRLGGHARGVGPAGCDVHGAPAVALLPTGGDDG